MTSPARVNAVGAGWIVRFSEESASSARSTGRQYLFPTSDGTITLDTAAGTVLMGDQGGVVQGATATVDTAGVIDKRITATRIVLTGPFALAWRKKKDNRELYLLVEGGDYSMVAQVDPTRSTDARKFAAAINTAARGGQVSNLALSRGTQKATVTAEAKAKEEARRAALTPEARGKEDKRNTIVGFGVVLVIAGFLLFACNRGSATETTSARSTSTPAVASQTPATGAVGSYAAALGSRPKPTSSEENVIVAGLGQIQTALQDVPDSRLLGWVDSTCGDIWTKPGEDLTRNTKYRFAGGDRPELTTTQAQQIVDLVANTYCN